MDKTNEFMQKTGNISNYFCEYNSIKKRLKKILSNVLEIDEDQITDETSTDNVDAWDSFNVLMLVSELESGFNVKFPADKRS